MAGTIKGLNRLGKLFIGCILMLILAGGFFQVVWAPSLARSAGNPRIQTLREQIIRGGIFDYQGRVLAQAGVSSGRYTGPRSLGAIVGYDHRVLGQSGLEQAYDQHLLGLTGASLYLCQWRLFKGEKHYGNHLRLTIDVEYQRIAEEALGARQGAVVILDPTSGALRALVSYPNFDPNEVYAQWASLREDPAAPLLHRAVQGLYPPGSLFKMLVLAAALDTGLYELHDTFLDQTSWLVEGHSLNNAYSTEPGEISLLEAFRRSSNVVFGQLALDLGAERLFDYVERLGFGAHKKLGVATSRPRLNKPATLVELVQFAIGQGSLLVTPLDMALLTATIANGGLCPQPYLVEALVDADGDEHRLPPALPKRVISSFAAYQMKRAMLAVVEAGTGTLAQVSGIDIAGKTGSAENPHGKPHAWFTCFAPAEAPQIVVTVVVENGGSGGQVAAPIARRILLEILGEG